MNGCLTRKVAIITGAAVGIGAATAERFLQEGAHVVVADRQEAALEQLADRLDPAREHISAFVVDIQQEDAIRAMVQHTLQKWGHLDILINNAGVASGINVLDATAEEFERVVMINLRGTLFCCKHALPALLEGGGGVIVNVASMSSTIGIPGQAIYAPSKAGVLQLTRQLAIEFAQRRIRVNSVSPGTIETPMIDALVQDPARRHKYTWLLERHPIGRFGRAEEVASAICFLASDAASFITGIDLPVDGGYTAQ